MNFEEPSCIDFIETKIEIRCNAAQYKWRKCVIVVGYLDGWCLPLAVALLFDNHVSFPEK